MFKLPVCPYCRTVYRYGEVKKSALKKEITCYHCGKKFKVSRKGIVLLFLFVVTAAAVINVIQLYVTPRFNIILILITNVFLVLIGMLFIPYFISYKKEKTEKIKNKRKS